MAEGTIIDAKFALSYVLQPRRNEITLRSVETGTRHTFRVNPLDKVAVKDKGVKDQRFFVKFLFGQDNENDYRYLGQILNGVFSLTKKSRDAGLNEQTPAYIAFKFAFDCFMKGSIPAKLEVFHSGRCGRCGRKLTVPESVTSGFGPECIGHVMGAVQPCPLPNVTPVNVPMPRVQVGGTAALQQRKFNYSARSASAGVRVGGYAAAAALYAPAKPQVDRVDDLDTQIRTKIAEYKVEEPENYFQDGMLDDAEAFKVAYNKFRVELQRA